MWQSSKLCDGSAAPIYGVALTIARGVPPLEVRRPSLNPRKGEHASQGRYHPPMREQSNPGSALGRFLAVIRAQVQGSHPGSQHLAHGDGARLIVVGGRVLDIERFDHAVV